MVLDNLGSIITCYAYRQLTALFYWNWFASLTIGMMEYWKNGMVGIEDQNAYNDIDYLVIVAYLLGQK